MARHYGIAAVDGEVGQKNRKKETRHAVAFECFSVKLHHKGKANDEKGETWNSRNGCSSTLRGTVRRAHQASYRIEQSAEQTTIDNASAVSKTLNALLP